MTDEYTWKPHYGPQTAFCESWQDEVLYGGAAGGGKTDCLTLEASRFVELPEYHALVARRTYPMLQEVIDRTRKYYPIMGGEYKASEHRWYFPSGARISLGHCQHDGDEYNFQGKEFQFIGLDEAGQFLPKAILYLFSRCRSTNPNIPKRIRYASNPGGPAHQFLKDRFRIEQYPIGGTTFAENVEIDLGPHKIREQITRIFIPAKLIDNPSLIENDPGYVARLMQLPEIERMRLLHGIWDAFEGQAFSELNREVHGYDPLTMFGGNPPPEWERYRSFDWGYSSPGSVQWWAIDYDGRLWLYREWYLGKRDDQKGMWVGLKMSDAEIARGIKEREKGEKINPGPADPSIFNPKRHTKDQAVGPPISEAMANEGIYFMPADNDRVLGKQQFHSRLRVNEDGDPMIKISNECEHWWRTLPQLQEDVRKLEDIDSDSEDHEYDCTRYMCMFRPMRPRIPEQVVPRGSFMDERRRYIAAKNYASRHGVSMNQAYGRVR